MEPGSNGNLNLEDLHLRQLKDPTPPPSPRPLPLPRSSSTSSQLEEWADALDTLPPPEVCTTKEPSSLNLSTSTDVSGASASSLSVQGTSCPIPGCGRVVKKMWNHVFQYHKATGKQTGKSLKVFVLNKKTNVIPPLTFRQRTSSLLQPHQTHTTNTTRQGKPQPVPN